MTVVFNIYDNNFITPTKNVNKEYETKILDKQIKGDDKENLRNIGSNVSGLVIPKYKQPFWKKNHLSQRNLPYNFNQYSMCWWNKTRFLLSQCSILHRWIPISKISDRNKYGVEKMVYIRDRIIASIKRVNVVKQFA